MSVLEFHEVALGYESSAVSLAAGVTLRLPGLKALRGIIDGLRARNVERQELAAAEGAVRELFAAVEDLGGTRSVVVDRMARGVRTETEQEAARPLTASAVQRAREDHFAASRDLVGRWADASVSLFFMRPAEHDDGIEMLWAFGYIGQRIRPRALPFTFAAGTLDDDASQDAPEEHAVAQTKVVQSEIDSVLVPEFCSDPLVPLSRRLTTTGIRYMVDQPDEQLGMPFDLVLQHRHTKPIPHPSTNAHPVEDVWHMMGNPSKHLVFDGWIHRSLARESIVSISAQSYSAAPSAHHVDWFRELRPIPRLESLGRGTANAESATWPRMADLARHMFQLVGWDENDFVGHRCDLAFPIWRIGYRMRVDFSTE